MTFGTGCSQNTQMKQHVISAHEEKKPFKCDICGYSCSQNTQIKEEKRQNLKATSRKFCLLCGGGSEAEWMCLNEGVARFLL